jgi:hypothetical protein
MEEQFDKSSSEDEGIWDVGTNPVIKTSSLDEGKIRRLRRKLEAMAQNQTGFYANKERK